jgi:hypothetical protein
MRAPLLFVVSVLVLACAASPSPPSLPQSFSGSCKLHMDFPFPVDQQGPCYIDGGTQRVRMDGSVFGMNTITTHWYAMTYQECVSLLGSCNTDTQHHHSAEFQISQMGCQWKWQEQAADPYPYAFVIPPFAKFMGWQNVEGTNTSHWNFSLGNAAGSATFDLFVSDEPLGSATGRPVKCIFTASAGGMSMSVTTTFQSLQLLNDTSVFRFGISSACQEQQKRTWLDEAREKWSKMRR